ncbi:MAG: dihydropyrimidinase [Chloroflexota bacterium]
MKYDLVIKNGTVVTATSSVKADLAIQGEKIAAIGAELRGEQEIDATGKLVIPGGVDVHVHLEMPIGNFTSSDDFFTGTRAAALGGTTAVIDFVEAKPDQPLLDALAARQALANQRVAIDYGLHMTIGPNDTGKLNQVADVVAAGCASFKLYMAYGLRLHDGQLLQAFQAIAKAGAIPVVHAENWDVIQALTAQNLAQGNTQPRWHPRSRPAPLEGEAAGRVIDIANYVGLPLHIFHVSCGDVVKRIAAARTKGIDVTGETCPQYLLLTQDLYDRAGVEGTLPVCAPPLRTEADQLQLWQALANNDLQLIATDHCPFTRAEKATGLDDFTKIPGGVPSIESRLATTYHFGVRAGHLSLNRWVDLCATTPARRLGFQNKGHLGVGYDADVVVFDPERPFALSPNTLHENVDWTPYDDLTGRGWPMMAISRGRVIVESVDGENGRFVGEAGQGRFIHRKI